MFSLIPRYTRSNRNMQLFDDRFFDNFFGSLGTITPTGFKIDVKENNEAYDLTAELPGMKQEDIELTVHDGALSIIANMKTQSSEEKDNYVYSERRSGTYQRSFNLEGINEENIAASYEDGLLHVHLPKLKKSEQLDTPRKIAIGAPKQIQSQSENA